MAKRSTRNPSRTPAEGVLRAVMVQGAGWKSALHTGFSEGGIRAKWSYNGLFDFCQPTAGTLALTPDGGPDVVHGCDRDRSASLKRWAVWLEATFP